MNVPINDSYIEWVKAKNELKCDQDIFDYINEVLAQHKASWELDED